MSGRRPLVAATAVLVAALLASSQLAPATAAPAGPGPPIRVSYPTMPDGEPVRGGVSLNERGEFLTSLPDGGGLAVWRRGAVTPVTGAGVRTGGQPHLSDRGRVTGHEVGPGMFEAHPFVWSRRGGLRRLPTGSLVGVTLGANDRDQAWGVVYRLPGSVLEVGPFHPVAWDRGELVTPPTGATLYANDGGTGDRINDRGQVALDLDVGGEMHAAIWQIGGGVTDLGTLGGPESRVAAINETGDVVGSSSTAGGEEHAFLWRDGEMIDLGTLGGPRSAALDVNDRGEVLGTSLTADSGGQGFVWRDGETTPLGSLGGTCCWPSSSPTNINNRGQVVGTSYTADGRNHAVLWHRSGHLTDLSALVEDEDSRVDGINDRGQILGAVGDQVVLWHAAAA